MSDPQAHLGCHGLPPWSSFSRLPKLLWQRLPPDLWMSEQLLQSEQPQELEQPMELGLLPQLEKLPRLRGCNWKVFLWPLPRAPWLSAV